MKFGKSIRLTGWMWILVVPLFFLAACGGAENEGAEDGGDTANGQKETIMFADAGWESIRFHNHVARTILEEGYGYKTDVTRGSTPATFLGLRQGDIDVYMEVWTNNIKEIYQEALEAGDIKKVSVNFDDNKQGFYVPTYMIEGDPERGIEPTAPDLKSVKDLPKYWKLFKDPAEPNKGRIFGAPSGWAVDQILVQKMETYGLNETYNYFRPGSGTALTASLTKAYEAGEPWVGYYWEPTWVMGKYDMTLLKEPPYDPEVWEETKGCAFPAVEVAIAVHKDLPEKAPEVVEFLSHYHTSSDLTNEALAYMQENDATAKEAARWWMKQYPDLWTKWVPQDVAEKVKSALQ